MPLSRRHFLFTGTASLAAGALLPAVAAPPPKKQAPVDFKSWSSIREQFDINPDYVHLGLFYIASHPRPVRAAIEKYRQQLDGNPLDTVEKGMFQAPENNLPLRAATAVAGYIGASAGDIALTQNTTTGLALLYHGLPLRAGDEVLTTDHDHYSHHESIRLAVERAGATWRKIPLFESWDGISKDGIVDRIRRAIRPNTRVVGVTWVHSASGLKLPLAEIAEALREVNASRGQRVLLVVDGVHGVGVEDPKVAQTGIDAIAAGTHKWIMGPRGTGFVWAKPEVWAAMKPVIPSFTSFEAYDAWINEKAVAGPHTAPMFSPGGFWAFEHYWALPEAFAFHHAIGPARVTARIHELNAQVKEGLAKMPKVKLYTPRAEDLSSGIVCFDIEGLTQNEVVRKLHERKILASTTPYRVSYARVAFGVQNTPAEVERTLREIRALA